MSEAPDAVVVGAGPNGLAAAIELARAGRSVVVYEAADTAGGGTRSAELTEPGFIHDVCSAIHPLLLASPFFRNLQLDLELKHPDVPFAHPLSGGRSVAVHRSVEETARGLGVDGRRYSRLLTPLVEAAANIVPYVLGPVRVPKHPFVLARFGLSAIRSARAIASRFETEEARALVAGVAAHSMLPMRSSPTAGVFLLLTLLAHDVGWPCVKGGSQEIADAMTRHLEDLGGRVVTSHRVGSIDELPRSKAVLFDTGPHQLLSIAGSQLPGRYVRALRRFRYGPGVFKMDWALTEPVPWSSEVVRRAGTVHVGGSLEEIDASETAANEGRISERPYVLLAQQSLFDDSRAPNDHHTLWGYCHAPSGSQVDMSGSIEHQIERYAPGFKDTIIARSSRDSKRFERYNPNYVGGDINGGVQDLMQHFARPVARWTPYVTGNDRFYLCSASTPPGGGVHGMCGYHAARACLERVLR